MSLNRAMMRARGMSGISYAVWTPLSPPSGGTWSSTISSSPGGTPVWNSSGSSTPITVGNSSVWWQTLLTGLPNTVASIWNTHTVATSPYGANAAFLQPGLYQQNQQQQPYYGQQYQGDPSGAGVNSGGLNLFGTTIGWGTIMLGVGIIVLLQMQPLRRK